MHTLSYTHSHGAWNGERVQGLLAFLRPFSYRMSHMRKSRAFTLIELLVVIAFSDTLLGTQTSAGMSPTSVRKWFYCPSNPAYNLQDYWTPQVNTGSITGGNRRLGYTYLNDRNLGGNYFPNNVQPAPRLSPL